MLSAARITVHALLEMRFSVLQVLVCVFSISELYACQRFTLGMPVSGLLDCGGNSSVDKPCFHYQSVDYSITVIIVTCALPHTLNSNSSSSGGSSSSTSNYMMVVQYMII